MLYHRSFGQGPDLVLLHGFAFNHKVWNEIAEGFASDYTVHLIDLPGHGLSQSTPMPAAITPCIVDLLKVMPAKAHLIGWSLGGLLATKIAIDHPERVQSLSLLASTPRFLESERWSGVSQKFFDEFTQNIDQDAVKTMRHFIRLCLVDRAKQKQFFNSINQLANDPSLPEKTTLLNALNLLAQTDLRQTLKSVKCPMKYFLPENDALTPGNGLTNQVNLEVSGHLSLITDPQATAAAMREFIDDCNFV